MGEKMNLAGLSQNYIDTLEAELEASQYCYAEYCKAADRYEEEFGLTVEWRDCVQAYLNRVGVTYTKAKSLKTFIKAFMIHADKVCETVVLSKQATDILTICVRCVSDQNEALKASLKELLDIIECLNDPILDPSVSIMQCLTEFKTRIDAGLTANLLAVKEVLKLMRCLMLQENAICASQPAPQGLINDLQVLLDILNCIDNFNACNSDVYCDPYDQAFAPPMDLNCPSCFTECGDEIIPEAVVVSCDIKDIHPQLCGDCDNEYYKNLKCKYDNAVKLVCYTQCVWDYFEDLKQKAGSNLNATQAALTAAQAAKAKC